MKLILIKRIKTILFHLRLNQIALFRHQKKQKKILHFSSLASACDRFCIFDCNSALFCCSVFHDASFSQESHPVIIDRSKIRREWQKHRCSLQEIDKSENCLVSIYFDGRKDNTLIQERIESKCYRRRIQEEDIDNLRRGTKFKISCAHHSSHAFYKVEILWNIAIPGR